MSVSGHVTIQAVLPGQKAASVLPFERWNDRLVGTDFSYEDMVESQFFWKNQAAPGAGEIRRTGLFCP